MMVISSLTKFSDKCCTDRRTIFLFKYH